MKHLAQIQFEFIKEARKWEELSLQEQQRYLQRHPKSKLHVTAKPKKISPITQLRDKILRKLSKLPYIKVIQKAPGHIKDEEKLWVASTQDDPKIGLEVSISPNGLTFEKIMVQGEYEGKGIASKMIEIVLDELLDSSLYNNPVYVSDANEPFWNKIRSKFPIWDWRF